MNEDLISLINSYEYAEPQIVGNVAMIGLLKEGAPASTPVISLRKALRQKKIQISEGPGGYTQLSVQAEIPTLVRASEGFTKAGKQDRVAKKSEVIRNPRVLEVYCIEQGRWSRGRKEWEPMNLPVPIRRAIMDEKDQGVVWGLIDQYLQAWKIPSRTAALAAIYDALGPQFEKYVANFEWWENQVGMIVCINGMPSGLELFGAKDLFREDGMILLRESYVPEALRGEKVPILPGDIPKMLTGFFDELREGKRRTDLIQHNGNIAYATII